MQHHPRTSNQAKNRLSRFIFLGLALWAMPFFWFGCSTRSEKAGIRILWADWQPAEALNELAKLYTKQTGISVQIVKKSWAGAFMTATLAEFRNRGDHYDIIIGDSQWLGLGAEGGHYLELTDWVSSHIPKDKLVPESFKWYGEYPKGSGRAFAVPCQGDVMVWAYRKDLFEDARYERAFQKFLKRKQVAAFHLAPPATWEQLHWIAFFFKETFPSMSGVAMATSQNYDMVTMSFEQILWAMGGGFGNYENFEANFNTPFTIKALHYFDELIESSTEAGHNLGYGDVMNEYFEGRAAMICSFLSFHPSLLNPLENPDYHDKTGFFNSPAFIDSLGIAHKAASLGGQGMSVNAHISVDRQHQALDFIQWFSSTEVQHLWAEKGGFSLNLDVLRSEKFIHAKPYNPLVEEAFGIMKDFWSIPEFDRLMAVTQREISGVIRHEFTPEAAAARIQESHRQILESRKDIRWKMQP